MNVFGPVPSRRLGQSIGINNIPPKVCTYSCTYCQLGRTKNMQLNRSEFYNPENLILQVKEKLEDTNKKGIKVDYLTLVADGEPTLDKNLGKLLKGLKQFDVKTAVISNASLITLDDVKEDLMNADWVSLSVDSVKEDIWHKIDRPHGRLVLHDILKGIKDFSKEYNNIFVTETMLVKSINDNLKDIEETAIYINGVNPKISYILVPTRPPAEKESTRPSLSKINEVYRKYNSIINSKVECITGDEGDQFFIEGDVLNEILDITSVHPIKEEVLFKLLKDKNMDSKEISRLLDENILDKFNYENNNFYVKKYK